MEKEKRSAFEGEGIKAVEWLWAWRHKGLSDGMMFVLVVHSTDWIVLFFRNPHQGAQS